VQSSSGKEKQRTLDVNRRNSTAATMFSGKVIFYVYIFKAKLFFRSLYTVLTIA
jgi:hypothetical protein